MICITTAGYESKSLTSIKLMIFRSLRLDSAKTKDKTTHDACMMYDVDNTGTLILIL